MNYKSLMIGDWVRLKGSEFIFKVKGIFYETIRIECGSPFLEDHEISKFEFIPLTLEILEKNGFDIEYFGNKSVSYNNREIMIYHVDIFSSARWFSIKINNIFIKIKYVHELQHALRLCGLNELADNFKV